MTSWTRKLPSLELFKKLIRDSSTHSTTDDTRFSADESIIFPKCESSGGEFEVDGSPTETEPEDSGDASYDSSDNLARDCREYYEKRLISAAKLRTKWQNSGSSCEKECFPSSACSSGYFSLTSSSSSSSSSSSEEENKCQHDHFSSASRDDETFQVAKSQDEFSESEISHNLQSKIDFLRGQLLSLIHQDHELFKQLLTLNDTIEQLKESRHQTQPLAWSEVRESEEQEVEEAEHQEEDQEQEINDLLDEALDLTSEDEYTDDDREQEEGRSEASDDLQSPKSISRSQSVMIRPGLGGFQRQRISFPATGKNRRGRGKWVMDSPPHKRQLAPIIPLFQKSVSINEISSGCVTLPSNLVKMSKERKKNKGFLGGSNSTLSRPSFPSLVNDQTDAKATSTPEGPKHVKQRSIDSGVIGVGPGGMFNCSDSASESSSDL